MHSRTRQMSLLVVVAVAMVLGGRAFAQNNPIIGTWKLNLAKSKLDPGPPPMSETRVFEAWETDGVKGTFTRVLADGTHVTIGFAFHYDDKDYKVTGTRDVDVTAHKRLDPTTVAFTLKKGGNVVQTGKDVFSKNGRIWTSTGTGMNTKGQKVHNVLVLDKQ
jgi:hypothetical protein